jgi:hypothetical protein
MFDVQLKKKSDPQQNASQITSFSQYLELLLLSKIILVMNKQKCFFFKKNLEMILCYPTIK